jgi:S1-C subfamily serine protease
MHSPAALGAGFLVSPDGLVVTNSHALQNARLVKLRFSDGRATQAWLLRDDPHTDIALLRAADSRTLSFTRLWDSRPLRRVQIAIDIGNLPGRYMRFSG